jgi:hypothetical protein
MGLGVHAGWELSSRKGTPIEGDLQIKRASSRQELRVHASVDNHKQRNLTRLTSATTKNSENFAKPTTCSNNLVFFS